ncbi:MAG TPA: hypothetical protein VFG38_00190, partial [Pseudomonadales bacterium]|nr:hypothetical protein [Pseudomonadales bacterium]
MRFQFAARHGGADGIAAIDATQHHGKRSGVEAADVAAKGSHAIAAGTVLPVFEHVGAPGY